MEVGEGRVSDRDGFGGGVWSCRGKCCWTWLGGFLRICIHSFVRMVKGEVGRNLFSILDAPRCVGILPYREDRRVP